MTSWVTLPKEDHTRADVIAEAAAVVLENRGVDALYDELDKLELPEDVRRWLQEDPTNRREEAVRIFLDCIIGEPRPLT